MSIHSANIYSCPQNSSRDEYQYDELISPRGGSVFIPHKQSLMYRQHYNSKRWWVFLESKECPSDF